ncbi:MAG TPA: M23 family metallopeptidase [Rhizomicrobium sp.]|jgi:murein DD-endopeptidase MepM/ murein hydrolase activator NlpD
MLRRSFLLATVALAFAPGCAGAVSPRRLSFSGPLKQGGLVIGTAERGAQVSVDRVPVLVSPDGLFACGLEYDQKSSTLVMARFADGATETQELTPEVRKYGVQRINGLPEQEAHPTEPEIVARVARENALIVAARRHDTPGTAFSESLDWPVPGIVSSLFGSQRILNGIPSAPHFGIDIAAPEGTPIHAATDGAVVLAEPDFYLTGGTTVLDHGHGVFTMYLHQSALKAKVGDAVKRGDTIGLVGMKGRATGPHLHWGLNWFQMKLDPSLSTRTPLPAKA